MTHIWWIGKYSPASLAPLLSSPLDFFAHLLPSAMPVLIWVWSWNTSCKAKLRALQLGAHNVRSHLSSLGKFSWDISKYSNFNRNPDNREFCVRAKGLSWSECVQLQFQKKYCLMAKFWVKNYTTHNPKERSTNQRSHCWNWDRNLQQKELSNEQLLSWSWPP